MTEKQKKPKWLKKLKRLMKSADESDREALKETLEKLKFKANDLKVKIDAAESESEREYLMEKWALVNKHRKKGLRKLLGDE